MERGMALATMASHGIEVPIVLFIVLALSAWSLLCEIALLVCSFFDNKTIHNLGDGAHRGAQLVSCNRYSKSKVPNKCRLCLLPETQILVNHSLPAYRGTL